MSLLDVTKDQIDSFLNDNKKRLSYMESLFSVDDNRDPVEECKYTLAISAKITPVLWLQ